MKTVVPFEENSYGKHVYHLYVIITPDRKKLQAHLDNNGIQIQSSFSKHPVTGVTWIGAMSFASYFGWRIPTREEWLAIGTDTSIEIDRNKILLSFKMTFISKKHFFSQLIRF
mgnify:CR=1 FL=1